MAFTGTDTVMDRLNRADDYREGVTLSHQDVSDLLDEITDGELDEHAATVEKLGKVDVKVLRITKKAQQAIAEVFGVDAEEIWA